MKPTAGPWTHDWGFILAERADGRQTYLAQIVDADEEGLFVKNAEERTANASLMAAAPALMTALEHAVLYCERWPADHGMADTWITEARAALAEAGR